MSFAPAQVVEGQPRVALPFGLFSVLTPRSGSGDPHWGNGITWETLGCAPASGIGQVDCDPETEPIGLPKTFAGSGEMGEAEPFTVYGSYSCSPVGHTVEYAQQRATEHLQAREEARVEQALWTGDLGNNTFSTDAESVGSSLTVVKAVASLEKWLAQNYGSLGVLHMDRHLATVGLKEGVLAARGNVLYTVLGTPVVAGAGYDGPEVYATPALLGYRSDIFPGVSPASAGFDRSNNDLYAVAERTYVVGWDPCGTAVAGVTL